MKRWALVILVLGCTFSLPSIASFAQDQPSSRKVVDKVAPEYPQLARKLNLAGTVKVEAVVGGNGKVKSVQIMGGHPILAQAAMYAVAKWKWEPADHETREPVEVKFAPQ